MKDAPVLYVVVPCYNEEEVLPETSKRLAALLLDMTNKGQIQKDSKVIFVDDGSKDQTWPIIERLTGENPLFSGVKLAHNAGHQAALMAGMTTAAPLCDAVVTIDADLQDDINAMRRFVREYRNGSDVVYGVRRKRNRDTFFKRFTARAFYRGMKWMGVDLVYDHADYRLLSKAALTALLTFSERNLFLRGMVPLLGFPSAKIYYDRAARFAGESKYPFWKMVAFAEEGVTSLSIKPIRWIFVVGVLFAMIGIAVLLYALISRWSGNAVAGWTSIVISIWLIGGAQLIALALIGEYVGKIYTEVKHRPRFIIEKTENVR